MELAGRNAAGKELVELVDVPMSRFGDEEVRPDCADHSDAEEYPAHFAPEIGLVGIDEVGKDDLSGPWVQNQPVLQLLPDRERTNSPTETLCTAIPHPTVLARSLAEPSSPTNAYATGPIPDWNASI